MPASSLYTALGGYYVGDKVKPIKTPYTPMKFGDVDWDIGKQVIEMVQNETNLPAQFKKQIIDEEIDAIGRAWSVAAQPGVTSAGITSDQIKIMEELGEGEFPGAAGVSLDINPFNWKDKPGEMLKDTAMKWATASFGAEEIGLQARAKLWDAIVSGDTPPKFHGKETLLGAATVNAITRRTINMYGGNELFEELKQDTKYNNPLQMKGRGMDEEVETEDENGQLVRVKINMPWAGNYYKVGSATIDMYKFAESGSRGKKSDELLKATTDALAVEIRARTGQMGFDEEDGRKRNPDGSLMRETEERWVDGKKVTRAKGFDTSKPEQRQGYTSYVDPTTGEKKQIKLQTVFERGEAAEAYRQNRNGIQTRVDLFLTKADLVDTMGKINGTSPFDGLNGLVGDLTKTSLESGRGGIARDGMWNSLTRQQMKASDKIQGHLNALAEHIEAGEAQIEHIRSVLGQLPDNKELLKDFEASIRGYEGRVLDIKKTLFDVEEVGGPTKLKIKRLSKDDVGASKDVTKLLEALRGKDGNVNMMAAGLKNKVGFEQSGGLLGRSIAGGNTFEPSHQRALLRTLAERGLGISGKSPNSEMELAAIANELGMKNHKALSAILYRAKEQREQEDFEEGFKSLKDRKFFKKYIYAQKLRKIIEAFTPAYWMERVLEKTQYFGLQINEHNLHNPAITPTWIRELIEKNEFFRNTLTFSGLAFMTKGTVLKIQATKEFEGAVELYKLKDGLFGAMGLDPKKSGKKRKGSPKALTKVFDNEEDFKKFLNYFIIGPGGLTPEERREYKAMLLRMKALIGDKEFFELMEKAKVFRGWLLTQGKLLGFKIDKDSEIAMKSITGFMEKLFLKDKAAGIQSVTQGYLGLLDKFAIKLNQISGKLFGKLAPYIGSVNNLKELAIELITTALITALAAGTGGAGKGLEAIRWLIRWVVAEATEVVINIWEGLKKGDLSGIFKSIQKTAMTFFKYGLIIMAIPLGCLVGIIFLISIFVSTFSPVNLLRDTVMDFTENLGLTTGASSGKTIVCGAPTTLEIPRDQSNTAANIAYDIVAGLQQGFSCRWNKSPKFNGPPQDLFNDALFAQDPNSSTYAGQDLFWCTWLVVKALNLEADYPNLNPKIGATAYSLLNAGKMRQFFEFNTTSFVYVDNTKSPNIRNGSTDPENFLVKAGDAVIMRSPDAGSGYHAGVVYKVTNDVIYVINSNSGLKYHTFTIGLTGKVSSNQSEDLPIIGFARKK